MEGGGLYITIRLGDVCLFVFIRDAEWGLRQALPGREPVGPVGPVGVVFVLAPHEEETNRTVLTSEGRHIETKPSVVVWINSQNFQTQQCPKNVDKSVKMDSWHVWSWVVTASTCRFQHFATLLPGMAHQGILILTGKENPPPSKLNEIQIK